MTDDLTHSLDAIEEANRGLGRSTLLRVLQPGVPADHVRAMLEGVGLRSTAELEALYGWHNGISQSDKAPLGHISLWPGFYFTSIEAAIANYLAFLPDPRWRTGWLPVFADGGGDFYVVDLSTPDEAPIRDFRIEFDECVIEFDSLTAMASTLEQAFTRGHFFRDSDSDEYLDMDDRAFGELAAELNPDIEWWRRE